MKKSDAVVVSDAYLPKKKPFVKTLVANIPLLIMLLPGFIALLLFAYKPFTGLLIAFQDYRPRVGIWGSGWADNNGMEHFITLFSNYKFIPVLKNTFYISFLRMVFGWPMPIVLALLLNEIRCGWFKKLAQTLTYIPHFFSWVIMGGIFKMLFSAVGPVNTILQSLGMEAIPFFSDNTAFLTLLIATASWAGLGSGAIVYIAALAGVDESLYEAAYIDGATKMKQVIHITLPSILGTIITVFILHLSSILSVGFDQIFNMYNYSVYEVADVIDTYSYTLLMRSEWSLGTALGIFKSLVGLFFVLTSNWLANKMSDGEYGIL